MMTGIFRFALLMMVLASGGAAAQDMTKVIIGYTASTDSVGLFVWQEQGFFKQHHLDMTLQQISLNSVLPAALQSDSVQIAGPSVSVVLQAVENGLDLVAIAGGASTSQDATNYAALVRAGSGITRAEDLAGRKVGVPGLGATLHILTLAWLSGKGIDPKTVTFVEVPFSQMGDLLRAGTVDAVMSADPMTARILSTGTGVLLSYFLKDVPAGLPTSAYSTTRVWALAHPQAVRDFRAALQQAADFSAANGDAARAAVAKYIKFPPEILAKTWLPRIIVPLTPDRLEWWAAVMLKQGLLTRPPLVTALLVP